MFFDTHAHFDKFDTDDKMAAVIGRAVDAGVRRIIAVGASLESNALAVKAGIMFPDIVSVAIGYDRDNTALLSHSFPVAQLRKDIAGARERGARIVAVGEIGLDLHYSPESVEAQTQLFRSQLALARELALPVIVHSREAEKQTLDLLSEHVGSKTGVVHCFTGGKSFANRLLEIGFYVSFSGIVTFDKAAALRDVARVIPEDRLLIETDSPFLAPVPRRGMTCEPMHIRHTAEKLAEIRGRSIEHVADVTFRNAERLFG